MSKFLQGLAATLGAVLGWLLGPWDGLLYTLIACVTIDYVSGVSAAAVNHRLSSEVGYKGLARKVMIFAVVGLANVLDVHVFGNTAALRSAVMLYFIANEGISILENCLLMGLPAPPKLREVLVQLKAEATANTEGTDGAHPIASASGESSAQDEDKTGGQTDGSEG